MSGDFWDDAEIISEYSRAQAIEDGVLVDLSALFPDMLKEAGFRYPVACTSGVWAVLEPSADLQGLGQSVTGRLWDLLTILKLAIRRIPPGSDRVEFAPLFITEARPNARTGDVEPHPVKMWASCGPGDDAEPVITVLLAGED